MDGRRHSVDHVPISKTLVVLRRVRPLRDPSTNSMSKFSSLVDSYQWDTNSCNGISLRFGNGCQEGISSNNGWELSGDKLPTQRHGGEMMENTLDLACVSPSNDHLEGGGSNHGSTVRSNPIGSRVHSLKQKESYEYKRSLGSTGDIVSRVGSPSLCVSDALLVGLTRSPSIFGNDVVDALDHEYCGCGLTCCWSGTPRYSTAGEGYPLIS